MKKILKSMVVLALFGSFMLVGDYMPAVLAKEVAIRVANYNGKYGLPEYLPLETTELSDFYLYKNKRFGFQAYIPANMESCILPMNGDGVTFNNRDGFTLTVSGMHNALRDNAVKEFALALKQHPNAAYTQCGMDWYAIAYIDERRATIEYEKCWINQSYINRMTYSIPWARRDFYSPMIKVLGNNFLPSWKV